MDHQRPNIPSSQLSLPGSPAGLATPRRRSYSQPLAPPAPSLANQHNRPVDPFELESLLSQFSTSPDREEYDEELFAQLLAMSEEHQRDALPTPSTSFQPPPVLPTVIEQIQHNPQAAGSMLTQAFLSWLQHLQLQHQLSQPTAQKIQQRTHPQPTHQQALFSAPSTSQQQGSLGPPTVQLDLPTPPGTSSQRQRTPTTQSKSTEILAPDPGDVETDSQGGTEDKRRRNTAASARFRIKKKLWTLNLERSITDLTGRVEELEREAAELRRENGWLKEIVMLKSKRVGNPFPSLGTVPATPDNVRDDDANVDSDQESNERRGEHSDSVTTSTKDKGKGRAVP